MKKLKKPKFKIKFQKKYTLFSLRKRISALTLAISFLFCALIIRLSVVSLVDGAWLQQKAFDQWTRDLPITGERGKIYDTNMASLAVSETSYDVYVRGREVEDAVEVAAYLSKLLNLDYEKVLSKTLDVTISESLIKMQIDDETAKKIISRNLKGIFLSENIARYYPYGDLLAQILGFTTIDNVGQAGLEQYYNNMLTGLDGKYYVQSDLQGHQIDDTLSSYIPSVPGMNLTLTIDVNIQIIVEQVLEQIMIDHKPKSATCVIMNAKTGELISLGLKPSFNLNDIPRDNTALLLETVKNTAVVDVYEPGSTFKILTTAAALEENKTSLEDRFYDPGYRIVDGQRIKCWKTIGHGSEDLVDGFINSCNSVFMDLALRLGTDKFYSYLKNLGIGSKTGIDIASESSGLLMKQSAVKNVDLARIGFGQAVAVTPIQLLTSFCAAVNGGELLQPYLVKTVTDTSGNVVLQNSKTVKNNVISKATSDKINLLLENVATKRGKTTFVDGYRVGGKTGTAQKYENGAIARGKYVSSFFGTYPADNPEYAVLLLVNEPSAGAYYGSVVAAPYAKEIFKGIFEAKNIAPTQTEEVKKEYVLMPNLVGLSLVEASQKIVELGLEYELDGEGGWVVSQYPPEGTMLEKYSTIVISLGEKS